MHRPPLRLVTGVSQLSEPDCKSVFSWEGVRVARWDNMY